MNEKLSGYTTQQLQSEIDRRMERSESLKKVIGLFRKYGVEQSEEYELWFPTGQFDRCDPPNPYIESLRIETSGNPIEVAVTMTPDAWDQFLWMVQCKGVEDDDPK